MKGRERECVCEGEGERERERERVKEIERDRQSMDERDMKGKKRHMVREDRQPRLKQARRRGEAWGAERAQRLLSCVWAWLGSAKCYWNSCAVKLLLSCPVHLTIAIVSQRRSCRQACPQSRARSASQPASQPAKQAHGCPFPPPIPNPLFRLQDFKGDNCQ